MENEYSNGKAIPFIIYDSIEQSNYLNALKI